MTIKIQFKTIIGYWILNNPRMLYNPIIKSFFYLLVDFLCPCIFGILEHNIPNDLIVLWFDLSVPNLWTSFFYLTSKASLNLRSDFLALVFLTVKYGPGDNGLLLVIYSGMDTMNASRMDLYCCLSSHVPEDLYDLLIFTIHLCSYNALLLNNGYNTMVTICCFSHSYSNILLRMTHFCSNELIPRIESIDLVTAHY